jgi:hypothetical protein
LNSPTNKKNHADKEEKENVDFAAILTGREEVPKVDTLDTALATFQSNKKDDDNKEKNDLKFSVKTTDMSKIKEVHISTGKPSEKGDVVADLYKSETPSGEVIMDNISEGKIKSKDLKGPLEGKSTQELIRKMEKGETYVDISTADKPKGKVRGRIKKLAPPS